MIVHSPHLPWRPRALYDSFCLEVLATTDSPLDSLEYHRQIRESGWKGRVLPTFRPDSVIDMGFPNFRANLDTTRSTYRE